MNFDAKNIVRYCSCLPQLEIRHIYYGTFTGKWRTIQPVNRFIYIFRGKENSSFIEAGGIRFAMTPGNWLFIPAGLESFHEQYDDLDLLSVHFNAELFSQVEYFSGFAHAPTGFTPEWNSPLKTLCQNTNAPEKAVLLQSILWQMLDRAVDGHWQELSEQTGRFSGFSALLERFRDEPFRNFSVSEMADFMKMGKESFIRHFTEKTGVPPKTFFNSIRAAAIAAELRSSNRTISEISDKFGFPTEFNFSRFFKRYFKQSPRDFRKNDPEIR